jgi:hypothetical protein
MSLVSKCDICPGEFTFDTYHDHINSQIHSDYKMVKNVLSTHNFCFFFDKETWNMIESMLLDYIRQKKMPPTQKQLYYIIWKILCLKHKHIHKDPQKQQRIQDNLRYLMCAFNQNKTLVSIAHPMYNMNYFIHYMHKTYGSHHLYESKVLQIIKQFVE